VSSSNGSLNGSDGSLNGHRSDDDPLAARLRTLEWPAPSAEARERCWARIRERLTELQVERDGGLGRMRRIDIDSAERHGFSRKPVYRRLTPVEGWASRDRRTLVHLSASTGSRVENMLRAAGARAA
jgi:hypothetical protein